MLSIKLALSQGMILKKCTKPEKYESIKKNKHFSQVIEQSIFILWKPLLIIWTSSLHLFKITDIITASTFG